MELLGIGVPELVFIVVIALIVLGPKDMVAAGRTLGKTLRKIVTSPTWKAARATGQELQNLPTRLMREAGLDEELQDLGKEARDVVQSIDPRRMAHSFDEKKILGASPAPSADRSGQDSAPDSPFETDTPSEPDPGPGSSPEKPQV